MKPKSIACNRSTLVARSRRDAEISQRAPRNASKCAVFFWAGHSRQQIHHRLVVDRAARKVHRFASKVERVLHKALPNYVRLRRLVSFRLRRTTREFILTSPRL